MKSLSVKLENCFGINKLEHIINFDDKNVAIIYAQNGVMKTSYTNTFLCIQKGKEAEIKDKIFGKEPVIYDIKIDGNNIKKDDIFVMESLNAKYETNSLNDLLINEEIKSKLKEIIDKKNNIIEYFSNKSGLKKDEIEKKLAYDFGWENNNFITNIDSLLIDPIESFDSSIKYIDIFSVLDYINKDKFQKNIRQYKKDMDNFFQNSQFSYLEKGVFTIGNIKSLQKDLDKNSFFKKSDNKLIIGGREYNEQLLINEIKNIDTEIKKNESFSAINTILMTSDKGKNFSKILENNTELIPYLLKENLNDLWKSLWLSYTKEILDEIEQLKSDFINIKNDINSNTCNSKFDEALNIFNNRFHVPFSMEIDNKSDIIFGISSIPQVNFTFYKDGNKENKNIENIKKIERKKLDELNVLSKGEERALYLLNIILDIEKLKKEGKEKLIIVDDIADSFDYKNKYAIMEYLRDIVTYKNEELKNIFNLVILTHNFDFYRNLQLRLGATKLSYYVEKENGNLVFNDKLEKDPIKKWKNKINEKYVLALIPFVRNLIDYGLHENDQYCMLTSLLHYKKGSELLTFSDLKLSFQQYLGIDLSKVDSVNLNKKIINTLFDFSKIIIQEKKSRLEDKIILSISIRLKAEKFLINYLGIGEIDCNQKTDLRDLILQYKDKNPPLDNIRILNSVSIMTPENIHLNSFMYEPLIDMGIDELIHLYIKVSNLGQEQN